MSIFFLELISENEKLKQSNFYGALLFQGECDSQNGAK